MRTSLIAALLALPMSATAQVPQAPLTRADTDRIISVHIGQTLDIRLGQSAGTGSTWRMVPAKGLVLVGGPTVAADRPPGSPPIVGGPQTVSFRVRVAMGGELALTFFNARTFGGPDQRADTATFILEGR